MTRRRKTSQDKPGKPVNSPKEQQLIEREEFVAPLDPPNHAVPLDDCSEAEIRRMGLSRACRWPIMQLSQTNEKGGLAGIFVDAMHGNEHWYAWVEHPPTWMDPVLFLQLAREEPKIAAILAKAVEQNDKEAWKKIAPLLEDLFVGSYLEVIFNKFSLTARDLLSQWLLRQAATKATSQETKNKTKEQKNERTRNRRRNET